MTATLWHFTCDHGHHGLGTRGILHPSPHPFLGVALVWLTTEPKPDRHRTGLGRTITACDRMAYRYRVVDVDRCDPWVGSRIRAASWPEVVTALEEFGDPEHWWVATGPVRAVLA